MKINSFKLCINLGYTIYIKCVYQCKRERKSEKALRCYLKKNRRLCTQLLKYHAFYLVTFCYLLLKLPVVKGCIFGRSCSCYWCYCWRGEGYSIPFLVWYHTCQNTAKRNLTILYNSFYLYVSKYTYASVPIFKMTSCRTVWCPSSTKI